MKTCTKCGEEKPLDEYYKQRQCKGGLHTHCKDCMRAAGRARRAASLEKAREYDRQRYANDPERKAAVRSRARAHYRDNREHHLANRRAYYEANRELWEKFRATRQARKFAVKRQPYTRREIYERDGGVCRGCKKHLSYAPRAFQIDHIVPISLGGPDTPANVQLMCPACNRMKWANLEGQIHLPV